jgi:hypothetical protein
VALVGVAGDDAGLVVAALLEEVGVARHHIATLGLGGLVAALAVLLEDGADVLGVANLIRDGLLLLLLVGAGRGPGEGKEEGGKYQTAGQGHRRLLRAGGGKKAGISGQVPL